MSSFKSIITSRLKSFKDMKPWHKKRLEICGDCEFNSANSDKNAASLFWTAANLGEAHCTKCKCSLLRKTSVQDEECPVGKWGRVVEKQAVEEDYSITNLSEDRVKMIRQGQEYILDYGIIRYKSDTKVRIELQPKTELDFANLKVSASCGCTVPSLVKKGRSVILEIEYDSKRLSNFNKLVTFTYTTDKFRKILIRIKGTVKR